MFKYQSMQEFRFLLKLFHSQNSKDSNTKIILSFCFRSHLWCETEGS